MTSLARNATSWTAVFLIAVSSLYAAEKPFNLKQRVSWTTSRVKGSPDPPSPYRTRIAFSGLKFDEPLDMNSARGTDRLFIVERFGKVFSIPLDRSTKQANLVLDMNQALKRTEPKTLATYGFALHPQYPRTRFAYVTCVTADNHPQGTRVSRFRVLPGEPPRCDPASEKILIQWPSGGHNGGCLQFGPDGYLYIATGDASGIADMNLTGQDLSKLPGSILRIDVDRQSEDRAYGIPQDNPFAATPDARPEIYAYGLRQPWKFSFDSDTGDLWTGNVGQDLWEMIYRIQRGGNYGWSVMEASHPFRPERRRGPTPILPPVIEHDHANFRSITGGFVYHGQRLKKLKGAYIYGDYDTGRVWMLRYDRAQDKMTEASELLDSNLRLVGFGQDNTGELYLLDHISGRIHELIPNPDINRKSDFPKQLSLTGLFKSTKDLTPAAGLIPYDVIAPQWTDGASKQRYIALPGTSQMEFETLTYPQPAPGAPPGWKFPDGTVLVETIQLEMERGNPASRRRLETRILHHERLAGDESVGDQYWQGYTYIWNDEQTDAMLLEDPQGLDRTFTILDAEAAGGRRQHTWHFPSRTECTVCHNMAAKYVLGVQTLQMNRSHNYGGQTANQLQVLAGLGLFTESLPKPAKDLPRLADYHDETEDIGVRARSYLHANCSHCHRKWGGGNGQFQLLATLDLPDIGTVNVRPGHGTFQIAQPQLIAPGDPYRSLIFYRMSKLGAGRMPRIGSRVIDQFGTRLIHDWITQLPAAPLNRNLAESRGQVAANLHRMKNLPPQHAQHDAHIDTLLSTTPGAARLMQALKTDAVHQALKKRIVARGSTHKNAAVRDLFESFLPEQQRTKRLGTSIRPQQILALQGDPQRGRQVFFQTEGVQCRNCHTIQNVGKNVGPDLSGIGKKLNRAQILENILDPSRKIEPQWMLHVVETKQGLVYSGLLHKQTATELVLKDAQGKLTQIPVSDIEERAPQLKSLMPELLVRDMTAQQVADLISYLATLKQPKKQSTN